MAAKVFHRTFKPRKKILSPKSIPAVGDWISEGEAIAFFAEQCNPSHEDDRAFKNKVRGRLKTAVNSNRLDKVDGGFVFGDLMAWAKNDKDWAGKLQAFPHNTGGHVHPVLPCLSLHAQGHCFPVSIGDCHQRIIELETRNAFLEARIEEDRPYVEIGRKMKRPKK